MHDSVSLVRSYNPTRPIDGTRLNSRHRAAQRHEVDAERVGDRNSGGQVLQSNVSNGLGGAIAE
jgi:hypothetical protein